MMRALLLLLVMVCAMPPSADARRHKRYHAHVIRHNTTHIVYEPHRARSPAKELAPHDLAPFDQQEGLKFTYFDISEAMKPMDILVDFPKAPDKYRLCGFAEDALNEIATPIVISRGWEKGPWISFVFVCLLLLCVGTGSEILKLLDLSRARLAGATPMKKPLSIMLKFSERYLKVPSSLT